MLDGYSLLQSIRKEHKSKTNLEVHRRLKDERDRKELNDYAQRVNAARKAYAGDHGSHMDHKGYVPFSKIK